MLARKLGFVSLIVVLFASLLANRTNVQAQGVVCPGSLPSRLAAGMTAQVTPGDPNNMREGPGKAFNVRDAIPAFGVFQIIGGPVCNDGYIWWRILYHQLVGWTAEGNGDTYWLQPADPNAFDPGPTIIAPPTNRDIPPNNSVRLGEFAVEWYCNQQGYGVILTNNNSDWACTDRSRNTLIFILSPVDFDAICQVTYPNYPQAFAIRDMHNPTLAYNWSCYYYLYGSSVVSNQPIPVDRSFAPQGSIRLGEFRVEWYCNQKSYNVKLTNNNNDWACTDAPGKNIIFVLGPVDFDTICQKTYPGYPQAFAIRDMNNPIPAYDWSCYYFPN